MDNCILFSLPGNETLALALVDKLKLEKGLAEFHEFPDGETYVRVESSVRNKTVMLVSTLDHPDSKLLRLIFLAQTLRELGARQLCLISPYLPYLRQDKHFKPGDALTATIFAKVLSLWVDQLLTVDPHLHRISKLSEIYSIPKIMTLHACKKLAEWIKIKVEAPFIVGPDEESKQWVSEVAAYIDAPYAIISKVRQGDRSVTIKVPQLEDHNKTLVLVDDIISTGVSMLAALQQLRTQGFKNMFCIGVHALFDNKVFETLLSAGAAEVVSCNTIPHFTNAIDLSDIIANEISKSLSEIL